MSKNHELNTVIYQKAWDALAPEMARFHADLAKHVFDAVGIAPVGGLPTKPIQGGDEEFKLSLDWKVGSIDESIIGVDIVLADSIVRGHEGQENEDGSDPAVKMGILFEIQGYGGLSHGAFIPDNYTETLFTDDISVLLARIEEVRGYMPEFVEIIWDHLNKHQPIDRPRG